MATSENTIEYLEDEVGGQAAGAVAAVVRQFVEDITGVANLVTRGATRTNQVFHLKTVHIVNVGRVAQTVSIFDGSSNPAQLRRVYGLPSASLNEIEVVDIVGVRFNNQTTGPIMVTATSSSVYCHIGGVLRNN